MKETFYNRGGVFGPVSEDEGAPVAPPRHPILGLSYVVIEGPLYAVDGSGDPATREDLLADGLFFDGDFLSPPHELLAHAFCEGAEMEVGYMGDSISVPEVLSGESHEKSGTFEENDTTVSPETPDADRVRHWAVGALEDTPTEVAPQPSIHTVILANEPEFSGDPSAAEVAGTRIGPPHWGHKAVSLSLSESGEWAYTEWPTTIYLDPEDEEPYAITYGTLDVTAVSAVLGTQLSSLPVYLPYYKLWVSPVRMSASHGTGTTVDIVMDSIFDSVAANPEWSEALWEAVADILELETYAETEGIPAGLSRWQSSPPDPEDETDWGDPIDFTFLPGDMFARFLAFEL